MSALSPTAPTTCSCRVTRFRSRPESLDWAWVNESSPAGAVRPETLAWLGAVSPGSAVAAGRRRWRRSGCSTVSGVLWVCFQFAFGARTGRWWDVMSTSRARTRGRCWDCCHPADHLEGSASLLLGPWRGLYPVIGCSWRGRCRCRGRAQCRHCAGSHRVGSGAALVVFAHDTED